MSEKLEALLQAVIDAETDTAYHYASESLTEAAPEILALIKARTPAPEGEVVAWVNQTTLNAIKERPKEAAWVWGLPNGSINIPLYASPVVPVGVSEEQRQRVAEIVEAAIERHAPANSIRHTLDDVDAILAALRPTDTGRE
jgi:hypothetical protein